MTRKLKSERHHWWPLCVSKHWNDEGGCTHWIGPSGETVRAPAKNFGVIGNAHHVKLGKNNEFTSWDQNFEKEFREADDRFPDVIDFLNGLKRVHVPLRKRPIDRFIPQHTDENMLSDLIECIVSLAVRSPKFRESAVALAEHIRGPIAKKERNSLIASNLMHCQRRFADALMLKGKIAVLYSFAKEFIFGDGFYQNLRVEDLDGEGVRIIVPVTPNITVLFANPYQYISEPRLVTLMLTDGEVGFFNNTVQVYSGKSLFYRNLAPILLNDFRIGKHLFYGHPDPIDNWVNELSGVQLVPPSIIF